MENNKTLKVEVSTENINKDIWIGAFLELPAEEHEIADAFQRARITGDDIYHEYIIYDCDILPSLGGKRLDSPSIYELDFLARRLESLTEKELTVLKALELKHIDQSEDALISIKDVINLTYGMDKVQVIKGVRNTTELGEYAMDNDLSPLNIDIPKEMQRYLDFSQIGQTIQDIDEGVFIGDNYVAVGHYEKQEIYHGQPLPNEDMHTNYAFGLEVAKPPKDDDIEKTIEKAKWIYLPIDKDEANKTAKELGEKKIEDCVYFGFKSIIPQIEADNFGDMHDFDKLNNLAELLLQMTPSDQAKFKAVLAAEEPAKTDEILDVARNLKQYDFAPRIENTEHFFKTYMGRRMDPKFDKTWLDLLYVNDGGKFLLERLGAKMTDYGVISARGDRLYKNVMHNNDDYPLLKEEYYLIEVNGQKALFANERISIDDIPQGLIKYDMRRGDSLCFASIERNVTVDHEGTLLVKKPFDFNGSDRITLEDDDMYPNFLGEEVSVREFMETDYEQQEDLTQKMGGI